MIIRTFKRKILRITAYVLGSLAILLTCFHFWFINHAEQLLEDLVKSQSNGKLRLQVKKFKFNWFSRDMQLRNAVFYTADTATASTSYRFSVQTIHLRVREIFPFVFEKKMIFDSLLLVNPDIRVTKLRSRSSDTTREKNMSITQEMGRVYNSIQDALQVLKVTHFQISNGKFTLRNKTQPDELPVTISNIFFHLDNLRVDTSEETGRQRIFFSDNVSLQTHHQDIFLPDGRHRLSFANFRINIQKKMVEFDSCTIAASKGDSSKSSFTIFFDKLQLTNIDFDTLYRKEVIKADSVYCTNPRFRLDVELDKKTGRKKSPPRLNDLIQLLTGDLQLAFVVVNNASFDINILRDGQPSSFTSSQNNFEMQGLRIEKNDPNPLSVKSFAMAIRNYENFLRDSAYSVEFDSVLIDNNRISLSNFSVKQLEDDRVINSFRMPRFVLRGLSWDDLVFDQKLVAQYASLYRPVIDYSFLENKNRKTRENLFQTLAGVGDYVQIKNLEITEGQINASFRGGAKLQLENTNMSVSGHALVVPKRVSHLQQSLNHLQFSNGQFQLGNLTAKIEGADFTGKDGRLRAKMIYVSDKDKNILATAKGLSINNMQLDDNSFITAIDGLQWEEADIQLNDLSKTSNKGFDFTLKNILGANTRFRSSSGDQKLNVFFETLSADAIAPKAGKKPVITNLRAAGNNFSLLDSTLTLSVDHFQLADHDNSSMQSVRFTNNTPDDSLSVVIPSIGFSPDINALLAGRLNTGFIDIAQPVINMRLLASHTGKQTKLRSVNAGKIIISQPQFHFLQEGNAEISRIEWRGKSNDSNRLEITDFMISPESMVSAGQLDFFLTNFSFTAGPSTFDAGQGEIKSVINQFFLNPSENNWKAHVEELSARKFSADSIGNKQGRLTIASAALDNLMISSSTFLNIPEMVGKNKDFRLKEITGNYTDEENRFDWYNAGYDKQSRVFSIDSFTFQPVKDRESFMADQHYQADYTTLKTGPVVAGPFDIDRYLKDTSINIGLVKIFNGQLSSYRDKRLPFESGVIKPLPAAFIKKIPVRLTIDTLVLNNAGIEYTELNEKTNKTGVITLNRMNAAIFPVTNDPMTKHDSLYIHAAADLMDSINIKLNICESYDSSYFTMTGHIGPSDARIMNPVLEPLALIKIESGKLDTLDMTVSGGDYSATGQMQLFYHDLKVKLFAIKAGRKTPSYRRFASFLANTFFIKTNNRSRTGTIFFERIRDKSFFNYIVKITLSGITSSIGIKNNKKSLRQFKKRKK